MIEPTRRPLGQLAMIVFLLVAASAGAEPVKVCPANPHYFMFNGKPIVLVTSDHHYGAVMDRDFDFTKFLPYLGANGMNLTRIYPGGMFEPTDKYVRGNPLGPKPGRQILPWARSDQPGAHPDLTDPGEPSPLFDLDRWDPDYFARLRAFVELAGKHDIIVEVAFFNGMYDDCWPLMPLYHENNLQGVGTYEPKLCWLFTSTDPRNADVLERQKAYVQKIAVELNPYDNVIYDLCDEPNWSGDTVKAPSPDTSVPWLRALAEAFIEAEKPLPKKHVLGQTVQSASPDLSADAWCDWLPTEYVTAARTAFQKNYGANKPLVNVESDYYGHGLVKPYTVDDIRVEGWWFITGGGAGAINLNGEYYRGQETGAADTQERIVPQKKVLKQFMESLDLAGLRRFTDIEGVPAGAFASAVAEPGKQYAFYLFHGKNDGKWGAHFFTTPGAYEDTLSVKGVPAGEYVIEWINPSTGAVTRTETKNHGGGDLKLTTPAYTLDIAMRMRRGAAAGK